MTGTLHEDQFMFLILIKFDVLKFFENLSRKFSFH